MKALRVGFCVLFVASIGAILSSCESTTTDMAISVSPSSATLIDGKGSVVFTASPASTNQPLFLPLSWSVSDPDKGKISASGGFTAVYEGSGKTGNNAISVKDKAGSEGVASVDQPKAVVPEETNAVSTNAP